MPVRSVAKQTRATSINFKQITSVNLACRSLTVATVTAPLVYSKGEINLHRYFLPLPPDRTVKDDWKELSQQGLDTAIRYVTRRDAQSTELLSATAFTAKEERLLNR
jgi:hypothetical protein